MNLKKSCLGQQEVQYLGFHIGHGRIWADPDRVAALRDAPLPSTKKELQRFLGLANYYCCFIPRFFAGTSSSTGMLVGKRKGNQPLEWGGETKEAFNDIRQALCQNAVLYVPLPNRPFCLYIDASERGIGGAMLTQDAPSGEQPVLFLSCKLSKAERNYAVIAKEALVIRWAVEQLAYYL